MWSDAGAPYKGVTIRGVSESTPPSNYVKDVLGPAFTKATGINVEFEATSWDQMYDKAIKDMEANTGIYDFVYIEQDIIYSYLSRDFLVDITQSLKDNPKLAAPDFKIDDFTTFINYFKDPTKNGDIFGVPMEAFVKVYLYRKDLFDDPKIQAAFKTKVRPRPRSGQDPQAVPRDRRVLHGLGQGQRPGAVGHHGSGAYRPPRHPGTSSSRAWRRPSGVYNWGINADKNYAASVANGGSMNGPEAKAALE